MSPCLTKKREPPFFSGLNFFDVPLNEEWSELAALYLSQIKQYSRPEREKKCLRNEGIYFSLEHIGPAIATFRARYSLMLLIHTV